MNTMCALIQVKIEVVPEPSQGMEKRTNLGRIHQCNRKLILRMNRKNKGQSKAIS
jgi:hypothetical protein